LSVNEPIFESSEFKRRRTLAGENAYYGVPEGSKVFSTPARKVRARAREHIFLTRKFVLLHTLVRALARNVCARGRSSLCSSKTYPFSSGN